MVLSASALLEACFNNLANEKKVTVDNSGSIDEAIAPNISSGEREDLTSHGISAFDAFNEAYDCIGMRSDDLLKKGIQISLDLQKVET